MRNTDIRCRSNRLLLQRLKYRFKPRCLNKNSREMLTWSFRCCVFFFFHRPMLEFLCKHLDLIESVLIKYTKYGCSLTTTATRTEGGLPVLKIGD